MIILLININTVWGQRVVNQLAACHTYGLFIAEGYRTLETIEVLYNKLYITVGILSLIKQGIKIHRNFIDKSINHLAHVAGFKQAKKMIESENNIKLRLYTITGL